MLLSCHVSWNLGRSSDGFEHECVHFAVGYEVQSSSITLYAELHIFGTLDNRD